MTETYDAALSLLDRQIVSAEGRLIGKVDDVTIEQEPDGTWCLTELLVGPAALGPRVGGLLGKWMASVWQRLCTHPESGPDRIQIAHVVKIESAVHIDLTREEASIEGFEAWVRDNIIEKIPGRSA